MDDLYPLRALGAAEFVDWARMTCNTYGQDWREGGLRNVRRTIELDRTLAAFDGDSVVGGAAIFSRSMTVPGAVLPVAGVTLVAVSPTHRRRGILTAMMRAQLAGLHESGEAIAALNAAEATIYGRYGYGIASRLVRFHGDKRAMGVRTDVDTGDGTIRLLDRDEARPLLEKVYDTARAGAVGWVERADRFWDARLYDEEHVRQGATALRFAVHREPDGATTGYAIYRLKPEWDDSGDVSSVQVIELATETEQAYAALWRFLVDIDGHFRLDYEGAVDEPLPHLLVDAAAVRSTVVPNLWVRLVDVDRALAARRYATALDVVLEVEDAFCPWNTGRYRLRADDDSVSCERTSAGADLRLSSAELGAAYLGGTTLASLAAAGRVTELRPGAVAACTRAFRGEREPFHPSGAAFPAF
ncbi:GNAT family N-acetyltransferase [Amycolatopsis nigrescens]|uniref:GNAT family N-acetyltransferase n=1 Tax=Amycolatopsis nigrescens TaxID=381445 RepID=UPI00037B5124|nr:GNAT family N-acetyltransferase [Amycolatopsis nigrescens]